MVETAIPEEAKLLRRVRNARRLTMVKAAAKAGMSHQRWGQIERGEGIAPPRTIAHMASALEISPAALVEVGRADAADILREIERDDGNPEDRAAEEYDILLARIERIRQDDRARARLEAFVEGLDPGRSDTG